MMMTSLRTYLPHALALALMASASVLHAQVAEGQELVSVPGDGSMHELTLNSQVATTLSFPDEINMITGYGLVMDAARAQELMDAEKLTAATSRDSLIQPVTIVHYAKASPDTIVMRAVRKGTPCFMTVRCGVHIYLFRLVSGVQANLAVVVGEPGSNNPVREVKKKDVVDSRTAFNSSELLGILSKARQRDFLQTVNPDLYIGWRERKELALDSDAGDLKTIITEIQQWPQRDAIVLRCKVLNKSAREVRFNPGDVKVRMGERSYAVQLADSNGIVPPNKNTLLDVVIQGNEAGGKEHLSISNDFRMEVVESSTPQPPSDLLPPPNPLLPTIIEDPKAAPKSDLGANSPEAKRLPLPHFYPDK